MLFAAKLASATVVDFYGTGTYNAYNYNTSSFMMRTFSVAFSYDTAATAIDTYATQVTRPTVSLSLTINMWDGSVWSHTSNDATIILSNAVSGTWDGITVTTKWPMTETAPNFNVAGTLYPVVNYSFDLTKYGGGVFTDGDFTLPASPTFIGDLTTWNIKHAKLYIFNGTSDVAAFNRPLTTLGAPVPEPSTWAAIVGGLALVGAVWHRRRRAA